MGLCTYSSVRYVLVEDRCAGMLFRLLQVFVLAYVVVYSIVLEKSYQSYEDVTAETYSKIKGAAAVTEKSGVARVFDANDLVQPPLLENALFITTNFVENVERRDSTCACSTAIEHSCHHLSCTAASAATVCKANTFTSSAPLFKNYGMITGQCVNEHDQVVSGSEKGNCQIKGWCTVNGTLPLDPDKNFTNVVDDVSDWSLFVRINSEFPLYDLKFNSAPPVVKGESGIKHGVNQWLISEILQQADTSYDEIKTEGAIVTMKAEFDCNFDESADRDNCSPKWTFNRIDAPKVPAGKVPFSTGFNYYETIYAESDPSIRTVRKLYGLKLEISVSGRGGKFSIVNLLTQLGSGVALLSVATLATDYFLQYCWQGKDAYLRDKFHELEHAMAVRQSTDGILPGQQETSYRNM